VATTLGITNKGATANYDLHMSSMQFNAQAPLQDRFPPVGDGASRDSKKAASSG
jgi:hypothetical protein